MRRRAGWVERLSPTWEIVKAIMIASLITLICPVLLSVALLLLICLFAAFTACGVGFIVFKLFE
jgi:hypothetical protein